MLILTRIDFHKFLFRSFSYFGFPLDDESRSVPRVPAQQGESWWSWLGRSHESFETQTTAV